MKVRTARRRARVSASAAGHEVQSDGVSEFFEPPPPPPRSEPRERRLPPWIGPPIGTVPGVVALELPLVRTDRFAIFITRLDAYPEGFGFDVWPWPPPARTRPTCRIRCCSARALTGIGAERSPTMFFGSECSSRMVVRRLTPADFDIPLQTSRTLPKPR